MTSATRMKILEPRLASGRRCTRGAARQPGLRGYAVLSLAAASAQKRRSFALLHLEHGRRRVGPARAWLRWSRA